MDRRRNSGSKKSPNGNRFRVLGRSLIQQTYEDGHLRREYPLRSKSKGNLISSRNIVQVPQERHTFSTNFYQPFDQSIHHNVEVNVNIKVNTKPEYLKPPALKQQHSLEYNNLRKNQRRHTYTGNGNPIHNPEYRLNPYNNPLNNKSFMEVNRSQKILQQSKNKSRKHSRNSSTQVDNSSQNKENPVTPRMTSESQKRQILEEIFQDPVCVYIYEKVTKASTRRLVRQVFGHKKNHQRSNSMSGYTLMSKIL